MCFLVKIREISFLKHNLASVKHECKNAFISLSMIVLPSQVNYGHTEIFVNTATAEGKLVVLLSIWVYSDIVQSLVSPSNSSHYLIPSWYDGLCSTGGCAGKVQQQQINLDVFAAGQGSGQGEVQRFLALGWPVKQINQHFAFPAGLLQHC